MLRSIGAIAIAILSASVYGQAFNIDFGSGPSYPVPSAGFGAASGQAGTWNGFAFATPEGQTLVDINGSPTAATLVAAGCPPQTYDWPDAAMDADHHALLDSSWYQNANFNTGLVAVTFKGLTNGAYTVYSYSYTQADYADETRRILCFPGNETMLVGGALPANTFAEGITHTVHHVTITDGTLEIGVTQYDAFSSGYLNGAQLVPDNPDPPCTQSQQPASHEALAGTTTTFAASISGDVRSLKWTMDGVELTDTRGVSGSATQTLTIDLVSAHDAGVYALKYTCGGSLLSTQGATLTVRPACGTADFNGDGDLGTDEDIEAFFRVLAGGSCS